jgi:hypothetical protein
MGGCNSRTCVRARLPGPTDRTALIMIAGAKCSPRGWMTSGIFNWVNSRTEIRGSVRLRAAPQPANSRSVLPPGGHARGLLRAARARSSRPWSRREFQVERAPSGCIEPWPGSNRTFEDGRNALSAADAHRLESVASISTRQLVQQRGQDPDTGRADRVTQGYP